MAAAAPAGRPVVRAERPLTDGGAARRSRPATGSSPPAWSSTSWRSARSSSRGTASPWPTSSGACRTAKPGPSRSRTWSAAAAALSAGRHESAAAALDAAESILERLPADRAGRRPAGRRDDPPRRFARRTGDLSRRRRPLPSAEALVSRVAGATSSPGTRKSGRGCWPAAGPSSCGRAISTRRPASSIPAWPPRPRPGGEHERADCLGHLALVEALRGRLRRAAKLADRGDSGPGRRRAAAACPAPGPRGARRARLGAPGTG